MNDQVKRCTKCGAVKPLDEFFPEKKGKYGVRGSCKACVNKAATATFNRVGIRYFALPAVKYIRIAWRARMRFGHSSMAKRLKTITGKYQNLLRMTTTFSAITAARLVTQRRRANANIIDVGSL